MTPKNSLGCLWMDDKNWLPWWIWFKFFRQILSLQLLPVQCSAERPEHQSATAPDWRGWIGPVIYGTGFRCLLQILSTSGDVILLYRIDHFYGLLLGPYVIYACLRSLGRNFRPYDNYYILIAYIMIVTATAHVIGNSEMIDEKFIVDK